MSSNKTYKCVFKRIFDNAGHRILLVQSIITKNTCKVTYDLLDHNAQDVIEKFVHEKFHIVFWNISYTMWKPVDLTLDDMLLLKKYGKIQR